MSISNKQWLDVLIKSLRTSQVSPLGETLPDFPSEELQRNTTGLSSEAALQQAFAFYENVQDGLAKSNKPLSADSRLLDFGFGWGRISRVFMKDVRLQNIHGIDVDPDFVHLTKELFKSEQFEICPAFPPTGFADDSFDLIYAYSVFSHLSEKACQAWMTEFARILKPGGVVAFTTRHETFFDFCEWARKQDQHESAYVRALGQLFPDIDAARRAYRNGELVHASSIGVAGGGPRDSSFYGETWIPEQYARTRFSSDLEFITGYFDGTKYDQACFVLQKRR